MAPLNAAEDELPGYNPTGLTVNYAQGPLQLPRPPDSAQFIVRLQAMDGNCLFRSISDQIYGTPEHHALLRERCAEYLACERGYFEQFVTESYDEFLTRIQREGTWGDDVEIEALSEIFDCRVEIYASYTQRLMRTFHEAQDSMWPSPIRLQYEGNSHYNSLAPRSGLVPIVRRAPGEIEDAAIARARRRREAGVRRAAEGETDVERTDQTVLDESIRLSRLEFAHRSDAEMDRALEDSRAEWERAERSRMDEEVVGAILQQSVAEEEQHQLKLALVESVKGELAPGTSSSSAEQRDGREYQYPQSVYAVMSMGFPLETCIQAYHLVGDSADGIWAYCCQTLGR